MGCFHVAPKADGRTVSRVDPRRRQRSRPVGRAKGAGPLHGSKVSISRKGGRQVGRVTLVDRKSGLLRLRRVSNGEAAAGMPITHSLHPRLDSAVLAKTPTGDMAVPTQERRSERLLCRRDPGD